ncbi:two-component system sensor histidine kinase NtrB [Leeia oryzae]|uniref:two-component system sensor histidine kinase NtrB n=1 Tax=Leeia oryzae TaxID=356662 RepID=UPI00037C4BC5|nr:HAMP domain-containing sensor histidine kinase [Leeia oryzae]
MSVPASNTSDQHWRSLQYFSVYRLVVIAALAFLPLLVRWVSPTAHATFVSSSLVSEILAGYGAFALLAGVSAHRRWLAFDALLTSQIAGDIVFIISLGVVAGGARTGLPLLLLPYLAAAGLISRGRMSMLHAALASIALIGAELARGYGQSMSDNLPQAAMLALAYFAVAWLAFRFSVYAREKELLAEERGVDLAKQEEVNRLVIRDMHDGVLVIDQNALIRHYNRQALVLLGLPENIESRPLSDWPHVYQALSRWVEFGPSEVTLQIPEMGHLVTLNIKPVGEHRQAGAVIYVQDSIAEQKLAQQLKLAALGRLTANIAHEIRNPLSAITHAADFLAEDEHDPVQQRLITIVRDNANRLEHIVQDVLQLNRRDRLRVEHFDLPAYLAEFVNQFCQVEQLDTGLMVLDVGDGLDVPFDKEHLNQILWNLCRNAVRYCQKHPGSIRLSLRKSGRSWYFRIFNDGPPIPAELRVQLFEPFFTTQSSGTGLGLYIARELCAANGATLQYIDASEHAIFEIVGNLN